MTWLESLDDARALARERGVPMYVLLTVDWCPWCRRLEEETLLAPGVEAILDHTVAVRLDGDENPEMVDSYDFDVFPTALIFDEGGEFVTLIEGFEEPDDYLEALLAILGGASA